MEGKNIILLDLAKIEADFYKLKKNMEKLSFELEIHNPDNDYSELEEVLNINNIR